MDIKQVQDILLCKCPSCREGKMFKSKGNPLLFKIPKMNKNCPKCDFKFEMEPGFFYGAMYASYALAVAEMIACFIIFWAILKLPAMTIVLIITAVAFLTSTINYMWARAIWVYIFTKNKTKLS